MKFANYYVEPTAQITFHCGLHKKFFLYGTIFFRGFLQFGGLHYTDKPDCIIHHFLESEDSFGIAYGNSSVTSTFCNSQEVPL